MFLGVDSYDEVIEEIYEKYKGTGKKMAPELKLFMLIIASASAFHFSKSTFKNLPGVDKILQNNPDLIAKMMNPQKESSQFMTEQEIKKIGKLANKSFPKATKNGIWGDPTKATKKDGNKILNEIMQNLSKKCQTYLTESRS